MKLWIDGTPVRCSVGQSLLDLVRQNGLDSDRLSQRPLAAKIAGEVFTLNYVPLRPGTPDIEAPGRRAMAASGGYISLLHYCQKQGRAAYIRGMEFVLFLAIYQLWPEARAKVNFTVGNSLSVTVQKVPAFSPVDVPVLKAQMQKIVREDAPLIRRRLSTDEARAAFVRAGQQDKVSLLRWRDDPWFDAYQYGDYMDCFYGEMIPSTGYVTVWELVPDGEDGLWLCYPRPDVPDESSAHNPGKNLSAVFSESERWCELMDCDTLGDLNDLLRQGRLAELVRVSEALHEKNFSEFATRIQQQGAKAVLLAGPSSSGKTTSANRLAVQLRVRGIRPILMSLDDYYIDRDKIPPQPDGTLDLEHINTIDTALFREHLQRLLRGERVNLPRFDFSTGKRSWSGRTIRLDTNSVILVEGLHALNPQLLPMDLDRTLVFKLYVSALFPLKLDDHNRISTSYVRLLRRIVRDYETRNSSVSKTLSMWDSVRRGEERWIFPYQEQADAIFNSALIYELAVLKKHIFPLLAAVTEEDPYFDDVQTLVNVLRYVQPADLEEEIPPTSILREFVGGNSFYR